MKDKGSYRSSTPCVLHTERRTVMPSTRQTKLQNDRGKLRGQGETRSRYTEIHRGEVDGNGEREGKRQSKKQEAQRKERQGKRDRESARARERESEKA